MKSLFYLLPLLGAFVLAEEHCECPMVKCRADDPAILCQCINSRESRCKERCPKYIPTYLPCPISPPSIPTPVPAPVVSATPKPPTEECFCDEAACPMIWPQSCYCLNAIVKNCHSRCGGPEPSYQACPSNMEARTFQTLTSKPPTKSTPTPKSPPPKSQSSTTIPSICTSAPASTSTKPSTTTKPKPKPTNATCGGGRGNYHTCSEGYTCIKDPFKPGCGPECDGLGICVQDKMCGGFAAFSCKDERQICVDDPRDDCDPETGGADCGGLCMFESTPWE